MKNFTCNKPKPIPFINASRGLQTSLIYSSGPFRITPTGIDVSKFVKLGGANAIFEGFRKVKNATNFRGKIIDSHWPILLSVTILGYLCKDS